MNRNLFFTFVIAGALGCGRQVDLTPAATANRVAGDQDKAVATAQGVRVVAEVDAWSGDPESLDEHLTPLKVTIENRSGQPLLIRYNEFQLITGLGFRAAAVPPFRIEGSVATLRPAPGYAWNGFFVAPWYSRWYGPRYGVWSGPWAFDPFYYGQYYTVWRTPLPTEDMLEKAIPEGVLENNGRIEGFLYFQKLAPAEDDKEGDSRRIYFMANLVNAQTRQQIGAIRIPFVLK